MAAMSPYLRQALLKAVLMNQAYVSPTTVYATLFSNDPTQPGATELGITRKPVTFTFSGTSQVINNSACQFDNLTGGQIIAYVAIMDSLTVGNVLIYGGLATPQVTQPGDSFVVGSLNIIVGLI